MSVIKRWTQDGVIMIDIYIEDCLVIGKRDKIDELNFELKKV
jgi:hypothetical protein